EFVPARVAPSRIRDHDVRADLVVAEPDAWDLRERLSEPLRAAVILREAAPVMLEPMQRRRREDARLAHPSAEGLARGARPFDELAWSGERRADGRAQPLRVADHHAERERGISLERLAGRGARVPEPGSVHVDGDAARARAARNRFQGSGRI